MKGLIILTLAVLAIMVSILFLGAQDRPLSDLPDGATCGEPRQGRETGKSSEEEGVELLDQGGKIYLKEKRIEIPGIIAHSNMPLELFACIERGKAYESLLVLKCSPVDVRKIHLALIMFGLKPGKGPEHFGDPTKPTGDLVLIFVEWQEDDKTVCYRAEDLIIDLRTGKSMPRCGWAFTGSKFVDDIDFETGQPTGRKIYLANTTRTIISTYHDPSAILDNPTESGGVGHIHEPNRELMPKEITEVKVTIRPPNDEELKELKKTNEAVAKWEKEWREKMKQQEEAEQEKIKEQEQEKKEAE